MQGVYTCLSVGDHLTVDGERDPTGGIPGVTFKVTECTGHAVASDRPSDAPHHPTADADAAPAAPAVCMVDAENNVLIVDVRQSPQISPNLPQSSPDSQPPLTFSCLGNFLLVHARAHARGPPF